MPILHASLLGTVNMEESDQLSPIAQAIVQVDTPQPI